MTAGDKVWIIEDSVIGSVIKYGFPFSLVSWFKDGIIHEEYLENYEFLEYERVEDEEV